MKVVCIHKSENKYMKHFYYTIGKMYTCFEKKKIENQSSFVVINDKQKVQTFSDWQFKQCFKSLEQIRSEKLQELEI